MRIFRPVVAWLWNWLPVTGCLTVVLGGVFGYWATLTELGKHPHLPPEQLYWVLGTIWVLFALYAAMVAYFDAAITLVKWRQLRGGSREAEGSMNARERRGKEPRSEQLCEINGEEVSITVDGVPLGAEYGLAVVLVDDRSRRAPNRWGASLDPAPIARSRSEVWLTRRFRAGGPYVRVRRIRPDAHAVVERGGLRVIYRDYPR